MTITTRSGKGSELTWGELDGNFTDLDTRTERGWRDNVLYLSVDQSSASAPTLDPLIGGIKAYNFPAGEMTEAFAAWHINHDYVPGTAMYPHIHFAEGATTGSGTVRLGFEMVHANRSDAQVLHGHTTVYVEHAIDNTPYMHHVAEVSDQDALLDVHLEVDAIILVRVFRDGAHVNDTYPHPIFISFVDLHYLADRHTTPSKAPDYYTPV